jgi:hypothetical protein
MAYPVIDSPASCEIRAVIRFLQAKNSSAAEIHRKLCAAVYGQNVMSEGTVRPWCRTFKDGWTKKCGRPFVVSDDIVQNERWRFTISELLCEFHKFHSLFCTSLPGYHKFCARWVPEMLMGAHKSQRMAATLTSLVIGSASETVINPLPGDN